MCVSDATDGGIFVKCRTNKAYPADDLHKLGLQIRRPSAIVAENYGNSSGIGRFVWAPWLSFRTSAIEAAIGSVSVRIGKDSGEKGTNAIARAKK